MSARVAVIGASGTIGAAVSGALLERGASVLALSRGENAENAASRARLRVSGAELRDLADLTDVEALAALLRGADALVVAIRASPRIIPATEPAILAAALRAGVGRFVPDDFGTHSMATPYGVSAHFDEKKRFHEALEGSGIAWTVIYPGGIAEYFLPNLRPPATVYAWGDRALRLPLHTLRDIGAITARAVLDPRTSGHAVQLHANLLSTDELLAALRSHWPGRTYRLDVLTGEQLEHLHRHAEADPGDARLSQREIMGISYANYVLGLLGSPNHPGTLDAGALYPDHVFEDPRELLADPGFVFGQP